MGSGRVDPVAPSVYWSGSADFLQLITNKSKRVFGSLEAYFKPHHIRCLDAN
jgi:hypothetical protein